MEIIKEDKNEQNSDSIKTKKIIYKQKEKIIPIKNPNPNNCELYIIKKGRYCHFEKYKGSEYCVYHRIQEKDEYLICPYDPKHRILKHKYKNHLKVCNTLSNKKNLENNEWYIKEFNKAKPDKNHILPNDEELNKLYNIKFELISSEEFEHYIKIILKSYEIAKNLYDKYIKDNDLENYVNKTLNVNLKNKDIYYSISGINVDIDNDLKHTEQRQHLEKHSIQNEALSDLVFKSGLMNKDSENIIVVEFGAGKGGLSEAINKENNDKAIYILLERAGVRFKKENKNQKYHSIRFKTDIINFNLNYIDNLDKITKEEKQKKLLEEKGYNIIGIAKHICGCAFDISLTSIFNYSQQEKIKGLVMATCCHHICRVELLNHLYYYTDTLNLNLKEIIFLFKSTSWLFSHDEIQKIKEEKFKKDNKDKNEIIIEDEKIKNKEQINNIFQKYNLDRKYIGILAKYIIDIGRCICLINKGFSKTLYLKYCSNSITTENNVILALK
jgi:tRNA:m4X modification enzyme